MATAFPLAGVRYELYERRLKKRETWEKHADALRFFRKWIAPHVPGTPMEMAKCRTQYRLYRSKEQEDRHKLTAFSCEKIPWCIPCTVVRGNRRVWRVLQEFEKASPEGEEARAIHCVFTAPLTEDGHGWGRLAKEDINTFGRVVKDALAAFYGPGLGGWMSYQDFGESPFKKSHPHMDVVLNGWALKDGKPTQLEPFDPSIVGETDRLHRAYDGANGLFGMGLQAGTSYMGKTVKQGSREIRGALAYSAREMVDLRKLLYVDREQKVGWQSYENRTVDWTRASLFLPWYKQYRKRVRPEAKNRVHRPFGFMWHADKRMYKAMGFSGEAGKHAPECSCNVCDDWERVLEDAQLAAEGIDLWRG